MRATFVGLLIALLIYDGLSRMCKAQNEHLDPPSLASAFISDLLTCYVEQEEMPGLAVAVSYKGEIIYSKGFGWADLEQNVPVTNQTKFRLASVSKLFLAAAIAKLSEENRLDLDQPIRNYVPEFPEKRWPITVRQVACHTSGIRGYQAKDFVAGQNIFQQKFATTKEALKIFAEDSLLFEPGTQYRYSTFGFTLLTAVIENITGQQYEDYLNQSVLTPLGIQGVLPDRPEAIIANRSRFYEPTKDRVIVHASPIRSDFKFGGGGLLGTADDLVRLGVAHVKPGFFQTHTLNEDLFTEQSLVNGRSVNVGLAWRIGIDEEFGKVYHHSGALPGGRSVLMVWPEQELVLAAISNSTNAPYYAEEFAQTLSHVFLTLLGGGDFSIKDFNAGTQKLTFSISEEQLPRTLMLSSSTCSGTLETPSHIVKELEKRHFPATESLNIVGIYSNGVKSYSVILASDIGLHRLQLDGYGTWQPSGFMIELANKFEWEVLKHQFKGFE